MKLFGRLADPALSGAAKFAGELLSTGSENDRAAAVNFIHDDRVNQDRAIRFWQWCQATGNASSLSLGAEEYLREMVSRSADGTFLHATNLGNLIGRRGRWNGPIADDDPLATVLDLTGLAEVLRRGRLAGLAELQPLPAAASLTDTEINGFYADRLSNPDPDVRDRVVSAILEAISLSGPRHPTWAAPWDRFMSRIDETAESWLEAVGVPRMTYPRWILVLRYTAGEAGFGAWQE